MYSIDKESIFSSIFNSSDCFCVNLLNLLYIYDVISLTETIKLVFTFNDVQLKHIFSAICVPFDIITLFVF